MTVWELHTIGHFDSWNAVGGQVLGPWSPFFLHVLFSFTVEPLTCLKNYKN